MEPAFSPASRSDKVAERISVCIADDHRLVRLGIREILAIASDVVVSREAADAAELLTVLQHFQPDVLLLDLTMPGLCGTELIRKLIAHFPELKILVLSMHNEGAIALEALNAGAIGYVTKDADPEVLIAAIRNVSLGRRFLDSALVEALSRASSGHPRHTTLSAREWEVLRGIASGLSLSAIATSLHLSPKTVSSHKTRLMQKLGITSTMDLARYAMVHGLGS